MAHDPFVINVPELVIWGGLVLLVLVLGARSRNQDRSNSCHTLSFSFLFQPSICGLIPEKIDHNRTTNKQGLFGWRGWPVLLARRCVHASCLLGNVLLQMLLVVKDATVPFRHRALLAHPDLFGHLIDQPEVVTNEHQATLEIVDRFS
uniref:Uncharacterized protein n=1 Tax=Anopheles braziliensis TaxID=58242 RepID=A0A2M3ZL73_9DIPT